MDYSPESESFGDYRPTATPRRNRFGRKARTIPSRLPAIQSGGSSHAGNERERRGPVSVRVNLGRGTDGPFGLAESIRAARMKQQADLLPAIEGGEARNEERRADCLAERIRLAREQVARARGQETMLQALRNRGRLRGHS